MTETTAPKFQVGDQVSALNDGCPDDGVITDLSPHQMCAFCHCEPTNPDHRGDGSSCCPGPWYMVRLTHDEGATYLFAEHELKSDTEMWADEVELMGECLPPTVDRDRLALETAEYIANVLTPQNEKTTSLPGVSVYYPDDRRPPTDVAEIKAALLDGRFWISWTCDRVTSAMRTLHGEPTNHG